LVRFSEHEPQNVSVLLQPTVNIYDEINNHMQTKKLYSHKADDDFHENKKPAVECMINKPGSPANPGEPGSPANPGVPGSPLGPGITLGGGGELPGSPADPLTPGNIMVSLTFKSTV
jgi:hypothetical protein